MEQIFGSQWAQVGHWPNRGTIFSGRCWVLGSLLAFEHHQVFALFVAVHPTVCGQDTLVRKSVSSTVSQPNSSSGLFFKHVYLLELGYLTFPMNPTFFSLGKLWTSQADHIPYLWVAESCYLGGKRWCPGHPAHSAYSREIPWKLLAAKSYFFFLVKRKSKTFSHSWIVLVIRKLSSEVSADKRKADKGLY